jgi:hypothetical protein
VGLNGTPEDGEMPLDRNPHRSAIAFPQRGASFDIREEKGDGARWQVGHGRLQTYSWAQFISIVAWS